MKLKILTTSIFICSVILLSAPVSLALAANYVVAPLLVDVAGEPRDTFNQTITLKNNDTRPLRLYASVNEITVGDNSEIKSFVPSSMSDRTNTITSWIEITRGRIDLPPGEQKTVPLNIRINPAAKPGIYHAFIGLAPGSNRDISEQKVLDGESPGVVIRVVIGSDETEFLKLVSFTTDRFSLSPESSGEATYVLENTGDLPLAPKGDIIIYDNRGKELTTVSLGDTDSVQLLPGETKTYTEKIPFINRIGKNKAYLSLEYGTKNRAALYDTNFYYSMPWTYLLMIVLLLGGICLLVVLILRRSYNRTSPFDPHEPQEVPLYFGSKKDHDEYDHDINLKNKKSDLDNTD